MLAVVQMLTGTFAMSDRLAEFVSEETGCGSDGEGSSTDLRPEQEPEVKLQLPRASAGNEEKPWSQRSVMRLDQEPEAGCRFTLVNVPKLALEQGAAQAAAQERERLEKAWKNSHLKPL